MRGPRASGPGISTCWVLTGRLLYPPTRLFDPGEHWEVLGTSRSFWRGRGGGCGDQGLVPQAAPLGTRDPPGAGGGGASQGQRRLSPPPASPTRAEAGAVTSAYCISINTASGAASAPRPPADGPPSREPGLRLACDTVAWVVGRQTWPAVSGWHPCCPGRPPREQGHRAQRSSRVPMGSRRSRATPARRRGVWA